MTSNGAHITINPEDLDQFAARDLLAYLETLIGDERKPYDPEETPTERVKRARRLQASAEPLVLHLWRIGAWSAQEAQDAPKPGSGDDPLALDPRRMVAILDALDGVITVMANPDHVERTNEFISALHRLANGLDSTKVQAAHNAVDTLAQALYGREAVQGGGIDALS